MTYMNCPSTLIRDGKSHSVAASIENDVSSVRRTDRAWHRQRMEVCFINSRKQVRSRNRKEASIKSHLQVTFISADRIVDSNQMSSRLEGSFDLHLLERTRDRRKDMSSAQDAFSEFHEISDGIIFVMDDLITSVP